MKQEPTLLIVKETIFINAILERLVMILEE